MSDGFAFTPDELRLLVQYELDEWVIIREAHPINTRALLELRVRYHAQLVAPHYEEFFDQLYIAISSGKSRNIEPRHVIDKALPQLATSGTIDYSLAAIMFVNPEDSDGYPDYFTEVAKELSNLPEYKGRDLPFGLHLFDSAELMLSRDRR